MTSTERTTGGHIEVITGSMFSGKTEELLRRLERAEIAGQEIAVFKPEIDDRYEEEKIGSHNGSKRNASVVEGSKEIREELEEKDPEIVAVDEANFFEEELVSLSQELANSGKRVIVSGTDQTFRGEPFVPLPSLMAAAEYVDKLRAICTECGKPATRNQRLIEGEPAHEDDPTIMVGAEESYQARCRHCHELRTD